MFRVLLQYLISWCTLSAILLHLYTLSGSDVSENKGMTSTGLYMVSRNSEKSRKFEADDAALEEKDDQCTKKYNKKGSLSGRKLRTTARRTSSIAEDKQRRKTNERISTERTAHQHVTLDLCIIFACHIASRKTKTTFSATIVLLGFWKVYAFPVYSSSDEKRKNHSRPTIVDSKKHDGESGSASQLTKGDCQSEWYQNEKKCYRLFQTKMNYDTATAHCSSQQTKLVTLMTEEENTFVEQMSNAFHTDGYLWTGVRNAQKICSGTRSYANWRPGEPNRKSNCVVMVDGGQWKEFDCGYKFAFVCEKAAPEEPYSRKQLLLALLVPIFSCLTVAAIITTSILVSSIRRGNKPFQLSSRYARAKRLRKIGTWDMMDNIRRASLRRRSLRRREMATTAAAVIPNIEVTSPDEEVSDVPSQVRKTKQSNRKTKQSNRGTKHSNRKTKQRNKGKTRKSRVPWQCGVKSSKSSLGLELSTERSSGAESNSSLYELLVRLNRMDFELDDENKRIEVVELKRRDVEIAGEMSRDDDGEMPRDDGDMSMDDASGEADREKLVAKDQQTVDENTNEKQSFRNMAFRDSLASVKTNSSGQITTTSLDTVQDIPGKEASEKLYPSEKYPSEKYPSEKYPLEKDTPGEDTLGEDTRRNDSRVISRDSDTNSVRLNLHVPYRMDNSSVINGEELEMSENTKIVKVDVHRTSKTEASPGDRVASVMPSDPENDTPRKNPRVVAPDGESNCVELQSRVRDPTRNSKVWKSDGLETSHENTQIISNV